MTAVCRETKRADIVDRVETITKLLVFPWTYVFLLENKCHVLGQSAECVWCTVVGTKVSFLFFLPCTMAGLDILEASHQVVRSCSKRGILIQYSLIFPSTSAVIWATTPAWTVPWGPTYRLSTTWRQVATRAWTSWRTPWTTWTPAATSTRSWTCTTRCSALPCASSTCPTWGTRWEGSNYWFGTFIDSYDIDCHYWNWFRVAITASRFIQPWKARSSQQKQCF